MVKIILEKIDIEKLIKAKYNTISMEGLPEDIEVIIKVEDLVTKPVPTITTIQPPKPLIKTDTGSIDANASGLTNQNRKVTTPGGKMGQQRGRLPTF